MSQICKFAELRLKNFESVLFLLNNVGFAGNNSLFLFNTMGHKSRPL